MAEEVEEGSSGAAMPVDSDLTGKFAPCCRYRILSRGRKASLRELNVRRRALLRGEKRRIQPDAASEAAFVRPARN
jgi:hypothetical protein